MPIIASAIVAKTGKILLSRQFMEVTRIRIEGLLSAFPKLIGSGGNKQFTVLESGSVRYVYQPIEGLYLVVVTTKNSNIVEDLATLRLIGRLIPDLVSRIDEETISANAFEILFAMDEVVTEGRREGNSLEQILSILEMHSFEEDAFIEEKQKAEEDAKRIAKMRAKELQKHRKEVDMFAAPSGPSGPYGDGGMESSRPSAPAYSEVAQDISDRPAPKKSIGGMSLGRSRKTDNAAKVVQEGGGPSASASATAQHQQQSAQPEVAQESVHIKVDEKISAHLNREGGVAGVDIKGEITLTVADSESANIRVRLVEAPTPDFNFKTHPNINKGLFTSDNILAIKDSKPYPVHQTLGILRWRCQALAPGKKLPLSVNCWPGDDAASVEFELEDPKFVLENVVISMPLCGAFPTVSDIAPDHSYQHRPNESVLEWVIPRIDARSSSGTLDVSLDKPVGANAFFPTQISFTSQQSMSGAAIGQVLNTETGREVKYSCEMCVSTDDYQVL